MKAKIWLIILGVLAVAAAIGAALFVNYYVASDNVISLEGDNESETLSFTCENMSPGAESSSDYVLEIAFADEVSFTFVEGEESGLLPYLDAEIVLDGVSVYSGPLEEAIGERLVAPAGEDSALTVTFSLDLSVDNSAQGKSAQFYLDIKPNYT